MKIYSSLNADLTIQNFGSQWLAIVRGTPKDVELLHNALYNWKATETKWPEVHDKDGGIITFWTSRKRLTQGLFNILDTSLRTGANGPEANMVKAKSLVEYLATNCTEEFLDFAHSRTHAIPTFACGGQITAEKPDADIKDSLYTHFEGREEKGDVKEFFEDDGKEKLVNPAKTEETEEKELTTA